ncbi:MAG: B12-binding domain-containing radical SAM protein [Nanoarchaeota archaeon]|nr:B12-binding domain-containing radical SAM protein [Nanoarchaeota archaeon]MBU4086032.1 B12-binding domain-containing radical SAM protein [Nanoarchaeota archaeon]
MKKILLVEPGAKHTVYPPIGLMHLAAVLRKDYDVSIIDYSGGEISHDVARKDILSINPDLVGVRVLTGPPIPRAILISKIAKELGKIVVWGGPHPTILPGQTLKEEYIDSVVIGEGEHTFLNLLRYYFHNKKEKLEGVGIKIEGKIKIFPASKHYVDLEKLPLPAWDIVKNLDKYFPNKRNNVLPISTTRGCAFKCGFCHNSNKNVKEYLGCYRIANPERAIKEYKFVQSLVKHKIEILDVGEDLHLVSEDYARRFCKTLRDSKLGLRWYTAARYQTLTKEIIEMMADSGCIRILLGVESGSERIQKMNNKVIDLKRAIDAASMLRRRKIFVTNAYIFGHPTESEAELNKTLEFIRKIPADENLIQLYRPMPGTPYFDICVEKNKFKVPEKLYEWGGFGVLGHDVNVSEIPTKVLFSAFYRTNAWQQIKYLFNQQRFYLRNRMIQQFFNNFMNNRFTFKLKEYLENK